MTWLDWYWPAALFVIAVVIFGVPEYLALRYGGRTFSSFMARVANAGPIGKIWIMAWGLLIGGLTVHFLGWCVNCPGG